MTPVTSASIQLPWFARASSSSGGKIMVEQPNANGRLRRYARWSGGIVDIEGLPPPIIIRAERPYQSVRSSFDRSITGVPPAAPATDAANRLANDADSDRDLPSRVQTTSPAVKASPAPIVSTTFTD